MSEIRQSLIEHERRKNENLLLILKFEPNDTEQIQNECCSQIISFFDINGQLKIHPCAFHELNHDDKKNILEVTYKLKKGKLLYSECYSNKKFISLLKKYELQLDRQILDREKQLSDYFKKDLRDVSINQRTIFYNIKPSEIKRLIDVLLNNGKLKNNVPLMIVFAELNQVNNVSDFCACGEFIYSALKRSTKGETTLCNLKSKEKAAIENFMNHDAVKRDYQNRFTGIVNRCLDLIVHEGLYFSSPLTFANHFAKHGAEVCPSGQVNEETHLRLANEHVMHGHKEVIVRLSQDGTIVKHFYQYNRKLAVVIEDVNTGRKCIATFFKPGK